MAAIIKRSNGSFEIRFTDANGKRRSLYPGKIAKRDAESIGTKVDHIVGRQVTGGSPDHPVNEWLSTLPDRLYTKLVKFELAPPRDPQPDAAIEVETVPTIKQWTERYLKNHTGKPATLMQLEITARSLCKFLGNKTRIDAVTAGDAEDYRNFLTNEGNERSKEKQGLATNTVRRMIGRSKQFFNAAVKHELITRNPFAGEASAVGGNDSRLFLVPADWIESCIRKAPCEDWRIILAFARFAGMRSHECRIQRWEDIDLANNRMIIHSHKTPPIRSCPIFPELRPHLLRAREMAPAGAEFVQIRYSHDANLRTTLGKIITKAGLVPWPKLMQNLRATRETELLAHYPAKDVTSWLGNSPAVANKHYAMTMQASFDRAVVDGAKLDGVTSGVTKKVPPKVPPTVQDMGGNPATKKIADVKNPGNVWDCLTSAIGDLPLSSPHLTRFGTFWPSRHLKAR